MSVASFDNLYYMTDDHDFIWHIQHGLCEPYPRELKLVKSYLKTYPSHNHTFIDVGGHIGTQSLPYSRLFQKVIAFEPNLKSYHFFKENIKRNHIQNITLYNKGVFNTTTTCKLIQHSRCNSGCFYIKECEKNDKDAIDVIKLDDLEIPENENVDFIKIDTEGSEIYVLEGATELIMKDKPLIQVETNSNSDKYFGYPKDRIFEFLKQHDYKIYDNDGNNPLFYHV